MAERKWDPVQTAAQRDAQQKAEHFVTTRGGSIRQYAGTVHGYDANGNISIEFINLHFASSFVAVAGLLDATTILKMDFAVPFKGRVVVQINICKVPGM